MKNAFNCFVLLAAIVTLTACSDTLVENSTPTVKHHGKNQQQKQDGEKNMANNADVPGPAASGSMGSAMDANDKAKMLHALDSAPGKATHWVNDNTGVSYTVTPTKKISLHGNPYCREYETTVTKDSSEHKNYGRACVGADGSWHAV